MCRMLGIVASDATAVYEARAGDWTLEKHPACAGDDQRFRDVAVTSTGHTLVAHIRKRTVGPIGMENTHPFRRGRWVFAHNGTISDTAAILRRTSARRLAEVSGATDSERFFAYLLTHMDERGGAEEADHDAVEAALGDAARELRGSAAFGASNFLLSNGEDLYAFRRGRTLFSLERNPGDEVRPSRRSADLDATLDATWTARRRAVLVASEPITDELWEPIREGVLLAVRRRPAPSIRVVAA
jgi:glutamine amidotransferase